MNPRSINSDLLKCTGCRQVLNVIYRNIESFNSVNCSTAFHRIAVFGVAGEELHQLLPLVKKTSQLLDNDDGMLNYRTLSSIVWSIAKTYSNSAQQSVVDGLFRRTLKYISPITPSFDARGISQVMWSMAVFNCTDSELAQRLCDASSALLISKSFKAQELSMLIWSIATSRLSVSRDMLSLICTACKGSIRYFTGQGLAQVAWAVARLNFRDPTLMNAIASQIETVQADIQALASLVWAFSTLDLGTNAIYSKLSSLVLKADFTASSFQTLGQCIDGFSKWSNAEQVLTILYENVDDGAIAKMSLTELVHMISSVAQTDNISPRLPIALSQRVVQCLPDMDGEALGVSASALIRLSSKKIIKFTSDERKRIRSEVSKSVKVDAFHLNWRAIGYIELLIRKVCVRESRWSKKADVDELSVNLSERFRSLSDLIRSAAHARNTVPGKSLAAMRPRPTAGLKAGSHILILGNDPENHLQLCGKHHGRYLITHWNRSLSRFSSTTPSTWIDDDYFYDGCIIRFPYSIGNLAWSKISDHITHRFLGEFAMLISLAASKLTSGSLVWIVGLPEEGVDGVAAKRALSPLFTEITPMISTDVVIIKATRAETTTAKSQFQDWITTTTLQFDSHGSRHWHVAPGMFANGGLDVMTASLLPLIQMPVKHRARVLDFGCGSGVISSFLLEKRPDLRITMVDCDAVAIHVAKVNVPNAHEYHIADGWPKTTASYRYHMIVSNPPFHSGQPDDFSIVQELIDGASCRLRSSGVLYIVSQEQIPIGRMFAISTSKYHSVHVMPSTDPRFVVWIATTSSSGDSTENDSHQAKRRKILQ